MTDATHLARLWAAPPLPAAPRRIALLTGQSQLDQSPLSPVQADFLEAITPPGWSALPFGFPWDGTPAAPPISFGRAARNSIRQYLWARTSSSYARAVATALTRLFTSSDRLVLITGSAGLAMLNAAEPHLPPHPDLTVIALAPAGRRPRLACRFTALRGKGDHYARLLGPKADHLFDGDHYACWTAPDARRLVRGLMPA